MQTKSATTCVLPRATWCGLQCDLWMAAAGVGVGGALLRPGCEPRPAAIRAFPEAT